MWELREKNCKDGKSIYKRKTDVFVPLINRAKIANNKKADLFISIHCDAIANKNNAASAYGVSTFTMGAAKTEANLAVAKRENSVILLEDNYETTYQGFDPKSPESYIMFELLQGTHQKQSIEFAQCVQTQIKQRAKRNDRSVRQTPALVLKEAGMPAVLIEIGFLSNLKEEAYLITQAGQNAIANSIYYAFQDYKKSYDKQNQITTSTIKESNPLTTESKVRDDSTSEIIKKQPAKVNTESPKTTVSNQKTTSVSKTTNNSKSVTNKGEISYRIQFLTSQKLYKEGDAKFKGLKNIGYYKDGNLYKYYIGNKPTAQGLSSELKSVKAKFNDAFIIKMKDGKRVK